MWLQRCAAVGVLGIAALVALAGPARAGGTGCEETRAMAAANVVCADPSTNWSGFATNSNTNSRGVFVTNNPWGATYAEPQYPSPQDLEPTPAPSRWLPVLAVTVVALAVPLIHLVLGLLTLVILQSRERRRRPDESVTFLAMLE